MNEKANSALQKAQQERKRGQFSKATKRLEQAIASFPEELDLYLEAVDTCIDGGEVMQAVNFIKTMQDKFTRERDRITQFVREKLQAVHDPSLARCVIEHAVKRRDLEAAIALLDDVPDHTVRDLFGRAKTKMQSLKSATHGGYTLRGEMVTNELTNALLSVRLGNMKEAMTTLVKILEDKPVEHKMLDPFLAALEVKHPKSGRIRFARGCALRAAGNETDAISRFIEAARLEPASAAVSAEQLKALGASTRHAARAQRALAEVLLLKGDLDDAAATLREILGSNPEHAREIIMLVRPYLDPTHGLNACTWLAIEAALSVEQSSVALDILRPLQQRGGHGPELYRWLENRAAQGFLPADVMMFHGALAINQKQFERAAEILSAVCTTSPQDVQAVLGIIDRHRGDHPSLEALYGQHAAAASEEPGTTTEDTGDFQMFENKEFRLEASEGFAAAPRPAAEASKGPAASGVGRKPVLKKSLVDMQDLSLDEDAAPEAEPVTESHVRNVAQKLYEVGASAFFHIEDDGRGGDVPKSEAADVTVAPPAPPFPDGPATPAATPAPGAESPLPETFEAAFERYARGELDNGSILSLLERAVVDGRVDELHKLLQFQPRTGEEHIAHGYYQAEFHALRNRPLQALEILARLDTPELADEQRRRVWFKIAVCQRMTHNFEGANDTLQRLVERFPDNPEYARLKRRNHEQFLDAQGREAPVLEKTSSLD
jgi:tetratricopeptide (TPR) repeat protein